MDRFELIERHFRLADAGRQMEALQGGQAWPVNTGQRLAAWQVTTGPLNRVLLLRACGDAPFARSPDDTAPLLDQRIEALREIRQFNPQGSWAQLHELRIYTLNPGDAEEFERLMTSVLPVRERFSPNLGTWRAMSGNPDRVFHMWAYTDLAERNGLRSQIDANPDWQDYVAAITPLIAEMQSMLLAPLPLH